MSSISSFVHTPGTLLSDLDENTLLAHITRHFQSSAKIGGQKEGEGSAGNQELANDPNTQALRSSHARVLVGPGDDCAVVATADPERFQLLKTDCLIEKVHFLRNQPPDQVGWKAMARVISDIAACGGIPEWALLTVAAPRDLTLEYLDQIAVGCARAANHYGIAVVGGETAHSPQDLFISVALTGSVHSRQLVLRNGGQAGDALLVTGTLGGSAAGKHLTFTPRLHEAQWLTTHYSLHAMMDLSDGLGCDLPRLADASHTGYALNFEHLPITPGSSLNAALSEGEDYELLVALDPQEIPNLFKQWSKQFPLCPLTCIGVLRSEIEDRTPLPKGYLHF